MRHSFMHRATVAILVGLLLLVAGCSARPSSRAETSSTGDATASAASTAAVSGFEMAESATGTGQGASGQSASIPGSSTGVPIAPSGAGTSSAKKSTRSLSVTFVNGTKAKPLNATVIVIGAVSFRPNTSVKLDRGILSPVPAKGNVELVIYPDGPNGKKVSFPLNMQQDFGAKKTQPSVDVAISDTSVQVLKRGSKSMGMATVARF